MTPLKLSLSGIGPMVRMRHEAKRGFTLVMTAATTEPFSGTMRPDTSRRTFTVRSSMLFSPTTEA